MTNEAGFKQLVIDAIVGVGFAGQMTLAMECERAGLAEYTGNQHNPSWAWRRAKLEACGLEMLQELYQGLREARDEQNAPVDEVATEPESLIILQ